MKQRSASVSQRNSLETARLEKTAEGPFYGLLAEFVRAGESGSNVAVVPARSRRSRSFCLGRSLIISGLSLIGGCFTHPIEQGSQCCRQDQIQCNTIKSAVPGKGPATEL